MDLVHICVNWGNFTEYNKYVVMRLYCSDIEGLDILF